MKCHFLNLAVASVLVASACCISCRNSGGSGDVPNNSDPSAEVERSKQIEKGMKLDELQRRERYKQYPQHPEKIEPTSRPEYERIPAKEKDAPNPG